MSTTVTDLGSPETIEEVPELPDLGADRRRFTRAVLIGIAVVTVPYLWVLWDLFSGGADFFRSVAPDNFYDLQARALFHGHLYVPNGSLGIEGFVYQGHTYTYFGLFPALLRMPILLVTSSLDGRLTAPSILLSWIVTGLFTCLLLWRTRHLVRGPVPLGRGEAACYGVFAATVMGGSVLVYLAASPSVYNEDMAWSVALTIGALFALLGVLEAPSRRRVLLLGCMVLAANLDRPSTGYACAGGALLAAGWLALARRQPSDRRFALSTALAGLVPLLVAGFVGWAKYRSPVGGYPLADQVWTQVNAHRRYFLAVNGGSPFSLHFLPSTLAAYFNPAGLHLSSTFPFISTPAHYPLAVGKVVLEQTQPTASIVSSMPLLFLLSCWGVVAAFRPRGSGAISLTRIPLIAGAAGGAGVLLFGFIFNRYSADLMPFLILAGGVGLVDICHRMGDRRRLVVNSAASLLVVLALFSIAANLAIAALPVPTWTSAQAKNYLTVQRSLTPGSQSASVISGGSLPYWAPANQVYAAPGCTGLYLSTGYAFWDSPGQQIMHWTWIPVEQSRAINNTIGLTFNVPPQSIRTPITLLRYGSSTLVAEPVGGGFFNIRIENPGGPHLAFPDPYGFSFPPQEHLQYQINVMTDPTLDQIKVMWYGSTMFVHYLGGKGPARVAVSPNGSGSPASVADLSEPTPDMSLCRDLRSG
jgi:hypothetical protein